MPYATNNDVRIYYEIEGEGPPILFHHGTAASLEDYHDFGYVEGLKNDYRLILMDARGHGKSDKPHSPESYTEVNRVNDITSVMDDAGIDRAHFFGYSFGGRVGLEMANYAPERLLSVMIGGMGPQGRGADSPTFSNFRRMFEAGPDTMVTLRRQSMPLSAEAEARLRANDFAALIAYTQSPWESLEDALPGMHMPFLVFFGESDTGNPYLERKEALETLPDFTFFSLPGLDHVQAVYRSDLVLPHVREFLQRFN